MKKLLLTLFGITLLLGAPAFAASEYNKCKIDVESDIYRQWSFDANTVPQKYKDMMTAYLNEKVTRAYNGTCTPGGAFDCKVGDIRKDCDKCPEMMAEQKARTQHAADVIKEKCESSSASTSSTAIKPFNVADHSNATMTVSGTVTDVNGESLQGATILAVGSDPKIGTITDADGKFSLPDTPVSSMIEISYMGYKAQTLLGGKSNLGTIKLEEDKQLLDEVVASTCASKDLPVGARSGTERTCDSDICKVNFNTDGKCTCGADGDLSAESEKKKYCEISRCKDGFDLDEENNQCVCDTAAGKEINKSGECIVPKKEKKNPVVATPASEPETPKPGLTETQSEDKVNELRENAQAMKDKERSLENRILGAAAIGATGIGGMNLASGLSEQSADKAAERDMTAYLATMRCDYGNGTNVRGGETDVMLPGGNDLIPLYSEYVSLAGELKVTKEALGLKAGIESEPIIDKASAGLYDNAGIGRNAGAFTSVSRALTDANSADAAAWAQQKDDAKSKTKTGMITAGAGIAGGIIGNALINTANKNGNNIFGKKVATNQAKEINKKYNSQIQAVKTTIQQTQKPTSTRVEQADDAIEVEPVVITPDIMQLAKDCKLDEVKDRIKASCNSSNNTGNGLTWSASICNKSIELLRTVLLCPGLDVNWANESNWTALDYACQLRDLEDHSQKVTVLEAAGGKKADGTTCTEYKQEVAAKPTLGEVKSDVLFASGKYDLSDAGKTELNKIAVKLKEFEAAITGGEKWGMEVRAYTDKDQPKPTTQYKTNQVLSEWRAKAVTDYLESQGVSSGKLQPIGKGEDGAKGTTKATKALDRRIEFGEIQWFE